MITLVSGKKISKIEEEICDDPFKIKSGGLVDMKNMKGTINAEIDIFLFYKLFSLLISSSKVFML